uniref:C-type lectin domain-containing protein n=1 Tax=Neolamprologus brichardi TaxID=32507 RepID=A0A3Q4GZK7_NEOBR
MLRPHLIQILAYMLFLQGSVPSPPNITTTLEYGLFSGSTRTFVYIDNLMTWTEAQSYCRLRYTDLASVRNMTENQKIDDLVPRGIRVWIGLFRDSWKWTNGSNSSLRYWTIIEPNNLMGHESCVAANFLLNAKWEDWTCDSMKEFLDFCFMFYSHQLLNKDYV